MLLDKVMTSGLFGDLDNFVGSHGGAARAAFVIKKAENFAKSGGVGGVPQERADAANGDEAHLFQFFQVMRKGGSGNAELFLDFTGDHSGGMGGEEQAEDLEAGFGAEGGEAVGGTGDEKRIGLLHISIVAEIW
jgi:hypothetical protein